MSTPSFSPARPDAPALRRLDAFGRRPAPPPMRYEPALDGLRAVSVFAVILYHAGFGWMSGGFYGVEVFFVVSGFLITALLLDERAATGTVSLRDFWQRRARRLLPALFVVVAAVAIWGALFGSAEQHSELRRDVPWALLYAGNWGQVLGDVAYYSPSDPPLLRHLWSLAVEEQWYIVWPLAFVALCSTRWRVTTRAAVLGAAFLLVWVATAWLTRGGLATPLTVAGQALDRTNVLYLSTFTRAGGLLLGAALAFVWRPWRRSAPTAPLAGLEAVGAAALTGLAIAFGTAHLATPATFRWVLPAVSVMSAISVAVAVHPGAVVLRSVLSHRWLVAAGRRSYGLYLWHWPVFVVTGAHDASWVRFMAATAVTVVVSEACYRFVETPVRRGELGRWISRWRGSRGAERRRSAARARAWAAAGAVMVVALAGFYAQVDSFDRAAGGADATFSGASASPSTGQPTALAGAQRSAPAPASTQQARLPRRLVIVGDSQAHSLAINLPDGIESTFTVTDGSVEGCGVLDEGSVRSARAGFHRSFADCVGWEDKWAAAARRADADIALVVLGAWDVFDIEVGSTVIPFGSATADALFVASLTRGIEALAGAGAHVALLEVPCMRPVDVKGAGVPALPERGEDRRIEHLNALLRDVAQANPSTTTFVRGPLQWCADEGISTDLGYRWDGVHVYKPGADLIYESIAPALLAIGNAS